MLPNQNNKLSSQSIVRAMPKIEIEIETEEELEDEGMGDELEKHGTHDQSSHGRKKTGVPSSALGGEKGGAVDIDSSMPKIESALEQAKNATSLRAIAAEEPRIRDAISTAYLDGNVKPLRALNEKYGNKRFEIDMKQESGTATDFDAKNYTAWDNLITATSTALRAFGEEPDYD